MLTLLLPLCIVASQAAGTDKTWYALVPDEGEYKLDSVSFVPDGDGAVSTNDTDYVTLAVIQGSTTLGSMNTKITGGAAMVAGTARSFTLSGGASLEFTGGTDILKITQVNSGAGKVVKGVYVATFKKLQASSNYV